MQAATEAPVAEELVSVTVPVLEIRLTARCRWRWSARPASFRERPPGAFLGCPRTRLLPPLLAVLGASLLAAGCLRLDAGLALLS